NLAGDRRGDRDPGDRISDHRLLLAGAVAAREAHAVYRAAVCDRAVPGRADLRLVFHYSGRDAVSAELRRRRADRDTAELRELYLDYFDAAALERRDLRAAG